MRRAFVEPSSAGLSCFVPRHFGLLLKNVYAVKPIKAPALLFLRSPRARSLTLSLRLSRKLTEVLPPPNITGFVPVFAWTFLNFVEKIPPILKPQPKQYVKAYLKCGQRLSHITMLTEKFTAEIIQLNKSVNRFWPG